MLLNLRDLKSLITGDTLDSCCNNVRSKLGSSLAKKLDSGWQASGTKLRSLIKCLLQIGANLSQTREFRDLFEDIFGKIVEPLEESGFSVFDMCIFLSSCFHLVGDAPENAKGHISKSDARPESSSAPGQQRSTPKIANLKKDWVRFVAFCRLCLFQLLSGDRRA